MQTSALFIKFEEQYYEEDGFRFFTIMPSSKKKASRYKLIS
jgi:hypothetical protein